MLLIKTVVDFRRTGAYFSMASIGRMISKTVGDPFFHEAFCIVLLL